MRAVSEILEEIKNDTIAEDPSLSYWSLNSMNRKTAIPICIQFQKLERKIENAADAQNPNTATGADLDDLVKDRGLTRLSGERATGEINFIRLSQASANITIPIGTQVSAPAQDGNPIYFVTIEEVVLPINGSSVAATVECTESGTRGNVLAESITNLSGSLPGVDYVTNPLPMTGGTDTENDFDLRQRYIATATEYGRATVPTIKEKLEALYDSDNEKVVSEAKVYNLGGGKVQIVVDATPSEENIQIVQDGIEANIAGGACAQGCLAAHLESGANVGNIEDAAGGKLWVRAREYITGETFTLDYVTSTGATHTATFVVPAGTVEGKCVKGTLQASSDEVSSVPTPTYSGSFSYDVLIGYGDISDSSPHPYLFLVPEKVEIDVDLTFTPSDTASTTLAADIKAAIETFLGSFAIGEELQFSDLYDAARTDPDTGAAFEGIDSIDSLSATDGVSTITALGQKITIESDARIAVGDVTATET